MTRIVLLAEAQGEAEAKHGSTLIGASGIELLRMMSEAELITLSPVDRDLIHKYYLTNDNRHIMSLWDNHPEVYRTNVFNHRPPNNWLGWFLGPKSEALPGYPALKIPTGAGKPKPSGPFVRKEFANELARLGDELLDKNPNVVVCLGNCALWALSGLSGIGAIRGTTLLSTHTVADFKLLPTYHPTAVLRNWDLRPVVIADLMKAHRESGYPEIRRPEREIWIEPSIEDIEAFYTGYIKGCTLLSTDIETAGDRVTCIGFAPSNRIALVVPFDDSRAASRSYWPDSTSECTVWQIVRSILEDPTIPKLFQNGAYDIAFLWRSMHIKVYGATEDTMLLNHALQPEMLKNLGFLGSIYSDERSWKGMAKHGKTIKRDN
jgi:uracil-DNA glycosylase